jgi:hypothetical protein
MPYAHAESVTVLLTVASDQLAVFWLLARAAAARHGAAALAAALPPPLLALALPPPLSRFRGAITVAREPPRADGAHPRLAPGNAASMARLRVLEAEAYIRRGDARAASRAFLLRLALFYAPHAALTLAAVALAAWAAWSAGRLALWLACAAMRAPGAVWRAAM